MPRSNYLDYEPGDPPPRIPPVTGGGGGTAPPVTGGGQTPVPQVPDYSGFNPGGGWSGGSGAPLPAYPKINIPGAPRFDAPQFVAPTMAEAQAEPGYQFRVDQANKALERSAAAQGRLRTGGTLSQLGEQTQNFAAQEYENVFNRRMGAHNLNYRAAYDAFAPRLQQWQLGASGERDAQLARYQADLSRSMRDSAPRYDPGPDLFELLGPEPTAPGGGGTYGGPSDYEQYGDERERLPEYY